MSRPERERPSRSRYMDKDCSESGLPIKPKIVSRNVSDSSKSSGSKSTWRDRSGFGSEFRSSLVTIESKQTDADYILGLRENSETTISTKSLQLSEIAIDLDDKAATRAAVGPRSGNSMSAHNDSSFLTTKEDDDDDSIAIDSGGDFIVRGELVIPPKQHQEQVSELDFNWDDPVLKQSRESHHRESGPNAPKQYLGSTIEDFRAKAGEMMARNKMNYQGIEGRRSSGSAPGCVAIPDFYKPRRDRISDISCVSRSWLPSNEHKDESSVEEDFINTYEGDSHNQEKSRESGDFLDDSIEDRVIGECIQVSGKRSARVSDLSAVSQGWLKSVKAPVEEPGGVSDENSSSSAERMSPLDVSKHTLVTALDAVSQSVPPPLTDSDTDCEDHRCGENNVEKKFSVTRVVGNDIQLSTNSGACISEVSAVSKDWKDFSDTGLDSSTRSLPSNLRRSSMKKGSLSDASSGTRSGVKKQVSFRGDLDGSTSDRSYDKMASENVVGDNLGKKDRQVCQITSIPNLSLCNSADTNADDSCDGEFAPKIPKNLHTAEKVNNRVNSDMKTGPSDLIPRKSLRPESWFAERGLMSQKSLRKFKKRCSADDVTSDKVASGLRSSMPHSVGSRRPRSHSDSSEGSYMSFVSKDDLENRSHDDKELQPKNRGNPFHGGDENCQVSSNIKTGISDLIPRNTIRPESWFAERGLMSQKSFRRFKKRCSADDVSSKKVTSGLRSSMPPSVGSRRPTSHGESSEGSCVPVVSKDDPEKRPRDDKSIPPENRNNSVHGGNDNGRVSSDIKAGSSDFIPKKSFRSESWFAERGLMSQKSLRNFKKRCSADDISFYKDDSGLGTSMPESSFGTPSIGPGYHRSLSDACSVDVADSFTAFLSRFDKEKKRVAFANLIQSMLSSESQDLDIKKEAGLTNEEVMVLNKMAKRLSQDGCDYDGDEENAPHKPSDTLQATEMTFRNDPTFHSGHNGKKEVPKSVNEEESGLDVPSTLGMEVMPMTGLNRGQSAVSALSHGSDQSDFQDDGNLEFGAKPLLKETPSGDGLENSCVNHKGLRSVEKDSEVKRNISTPPIEGTLLKNDAAVERLNELNGSSQVPGDILSEGMRFLSKAMLINLYGKLREMSTLGHASVKFTEIDVNSHQYFARLKEMRRIGLMKPEDEPKGYLERTKTAGFIVRAVLDEYEMFVSNELSPLNQLQEANMLYEASMLNDFKTWVEESQNKQENINESYDYFEKGSVMRNLVDTEFEVTWFSDRHPDDVIYCIGINRRTNTVTVLFRGEEGVFSRIKNSSMMETPNPISHEDYGGNSDIIMLRSSVAEEMLRVRRDTQKSIIEEIRDRVETIGSELANGGKYELSVAGHSLGGGLATILGFYLAADPSLRIASAIRVFTFASSRVGCQNFQLAFKHLEITGRLMHARFTNSNDIVSLRPFWDLNGSWRFIDWYKHVGMHICLYPSKNEERKIDFPYMVISHDQNESISEEIYNLIQSYIFGSTKHYRIAEYQNRMYFAKELLRTLNKNGGRRKGKLKELMSLDDLYAKRRRFVRHSLKESNESLPPVHFLIIFFIVVQTAALLIRAFAKMTRESE